MTASEYCRKVSGDGISAAETLAKGRQSFKTCQAFDAIALANAVQCKDCLLFDILDRHEALDGRDTASQIASASATSFLLLLTYGLTKLRGHQARSVAHRLQLARPVMGARACLHAD